MCKHIKIMFSKIDKKIKIFPLKYSAKRLKYLVISVHSLKVFIYIRKTSVRIY